MSKSRMRLWGLWGESGPLPGPEFFFGNNYGGPLDWPFEYIPGAAESRLSFDPPAAS